MRQDKLFDVKIAQPKDLTTGKLRNYTPRQLLDARFFPRNPLFGTGDELLHDREKRMRTHYRRTYKAFIGGTRGVIPDLERETMLRSVLLTIELADARRKVIQQLDSILKIAAVQEVLTNLDFQGELNYHPSDLLIALRAMETMVVNEISSEQMIKFHVPKDSRIETYKKFRDIVDQRRGNIVLTAGGQKENEFFNTEGSNIDYGLLEDFADQCRAAQARSARKRKSPQNFQDGQQGKRQKQYGQNGQNGNKGRNNGKSRGRGRGRRNNNGRNSGNQNNRQGNNNRNNRPKGKGANTQTKEEPVGSTS